MGVSLAMIALPENADEGYHPAMKPMTVLATGPSGPSTELDVLRAAGLAVVIGRPLDAEGRRPWSEADLIEATRAADVVLASHLELVSRPVLSAAERLQLVIVPFIGVDKIDVTAATEL